MSQIKLCQFVARSQVRGVGHRSWTQRVNIRFPETCHVSPYMCLGALRFGTGRRVRGRRPPQRDKQHSRLEHAFTYGRDAIRAKQGRYGRGICGTGKPVPYITKCRGMNGIANICLHQYHMFTHVYVYSLQITGKEIIWLRLLGRVGRVGRVGGVGVSGKKNKAGDGFVRSRP